MPGDAIISGKVICLEFNSELKRLSPPISCHHRNDLWKVFMVKAWFSLRHMTFEPVNEKTALLKLNWDNWELGPRCFSPLCIWLFSTVCLTFLWCVFVCLTFLQSVFVRLIFLQCVFDFSPMCIFKYSNIGDIRAGEWEAENLVTLRRRIGNWDRDAFLHCVFVCFTFL